MPTAQAQPVNITSTAQVVYASACSYRGFSIGSTAGATVTIYDNASAASGTVLAQFTLAAGGFQDVSVPDGVRCTNGIYLSATAAVQGHVRVG
jgi:hypothetical protein